MLTSDTISAEHVLGESHLSSQLSRVDANATENAIPKLIETRCSVARISAEVTVTRVS